MHELAISSSAPTRPPVQAHQDNDYYEVPLDTNQNYVERNSIINQLEDLLEPSKTLKVSEAVRVVLYGLGGAGKTEVAVHFAERHRKQYKAVFWVYGADASRMEESFEKIGKIVRRNDNNPFRDLVHDAQTWFVKNTDWLLVVDNIRCCRG